METARLASEIAALKLSGQRRNRNNQQDKSQQFATKRQTQFELELGRESGSALSNIQSESTRNQFTKTFTSSAVFRKLRPSYLPPKTAGSRNSVHQNVNQLSKSVNISPGR